MAGQGAGSPTERILTLAAYLKERRGTKISLSDITRDVPGYDDGAAPRDAHGELTSDTREWETLRRKVRRDLKDLAAHWDVVVEYDESEHSYALLPPFFSTHERAALVAASAAVIVDGPGTEHVGDLGTGVDDAYAEIVVRVPKLVAPLREACATRTRVGFRHGGHDRALEPYALGQWKHHWYVAGWCPDASAMRRYRLDRIEIPAEGAPIALNGVAGSYEVPSWFRADLAFDMDPNSWGRDHTLTARVRVANDHVDTFVHELGAEVTERHADHALVALTVRHYQWTRDRLLGFRGHAVPLDPPELVALVHDHLVAIAEIP